MRSVWNNTWWARRDPARNLPHVCPSSKVARITPLNPGASRATQSYVCPLTCEMSSTCRCAMANHPASSFPIAVGHSFNAIRGGAV